MKRFSLSGLLLPAIVVGAAFLRMVALNTIPISLNPDELAYGYNAYSLLISGADEWGKHVPLVMKSFGDWKMPLYAYATMLPVKLFGLNEFSVRIVSSISGIISVILIFYIALLVFRKKSTALFSALFFALSPWAIFFSRGAFDPNLGLTISLGGICCLLLYLQKKRNLYLYSSALLFGLSLFSYHAFVVFIPVFIVAMVLLYRKEFRLKKQIIIAAGIVLFFIGLSAFSLSQGSIQKSKSDSIFSDANTIYSRSDQLRFDGAADNNTLVNKLLFNRFSAVSYQIAQNYLASFSPKFLFDIGGEKSFYNIWQFGALYLFDVVLLAIGIAMLLWKREKALPFLFIWLVLAPLPSSLAREVPSQTRLINLLPVLILIEAYGAWSIWSYLKQQRWMYVFAGGLLIILYTLNVVYFLDLYFLHNNIWGARSFHFGYKEAVAVADKYPGDKVVMVGPDNFPYISFLFYTQYNPTLFRQQVHYYPPTKEGFSLVKSFGRYTFVDAIDRNHLAPHTLYIDRPYPQDRKSNQILYPTGDAAFTYFYSYSPNLRREIFFPTEDQE